MKLVGATWGMWWGPPQDWQGQGHLKKGAGGSLGLLKAALSVVLGGRGRGVCMWRGVLAGSPCYVEREGLCSSPLQPEVDSGWWAWLPESYQCLRNACGFSKPQQQAEEWGTSQGLSWLRMGTMESVPTRQAWPEKRFGLGLTKEAAQWASSIPACCP